MILPTKYLLPHLKQFTRKKKFILVLSNIKEFEVNVNSYWDEGSRSEWSGFENGEKITFPVNNSPPQFDGQKVTFIVNDERVLIDHGITRGKNATIKVYCTHPKNIFDKELLNDGEAVNEFMKEDSNIIPLLRA